MTCAPYTGESPNPDDWISVIPCLYLTMEPRGAVITAP